VRRRDFLSGLMLATAMQSAAYAQQSGKVHRIAIVHPFVPISDMSETAAHPYFSAFFKELRRLGYVEDQNLVVERRSGGGRTETYPELAREVVRLRPDLIIATSRRLVQFLVRETKTIPIVASTDDPIAAGLVTSLARPGGNVTGVSIDAGREIINKRLELLRYTAPGATTFAFLGPPEIWEGTYREDMQTAAREVGATLVSATLSGSIDEQAYQRAFTAMTQDGVRGIIVGDVPENSTNRHLIGHLAREHRLPAIYPYRLFVDVGGLMSYGVDLAENYRDLARQADRVLKGAHPGEVPYLRPTKFELVINLKAAKVLGLQIPPSLLARADEVIE
jgi:putative tryptophan/tyrosine transport system substrate-binding protein